MQNTDVTMSVFATTVLFGDMPAKTHDQINTSALTQTFISRRTLATDALGNGQTLL